jgi:hypothetical protein
LNIYIYREREKKRSQSWMQKYEGHDNMCEAEPKRWEMERTVVVVLCDWPPLPTCACRIIILK